MPFAISLPATRPTNPWMPKYDFTLIVEIMALPRACFHFFFSALASAIGPLYVRNWTATGALHGRIKSAEISFGIDIV